ncbi:hypothetical protein Dimus_009224 [Dionaea muscipula]
MEQHQFTRHAVSDLHDGDSGKNIVRIIFKSGWIDPERAPRVHRILKIHHSPRTLSRFEEYRESVKSKADEGGNGAVQVRDERCVADGNELLRFYCTTFACSLGQNGNFGVCNQGFCSVCGIIKAGFSPKLDGISTLSTSWRAHLAVPGDVEADFAFMNVKRAMLVCRVIAGRVGCDQMAVAVVVDKEDPGFDSVLAAGQSREGGGAGSTSDGDELLVFNPRAVLPCFVVVYSVASLMGNSSSSSSFSSAPAMIIFLISTSILVTMMSITRMEAAAIQQVSEINACQSRNSCRLRRRRMYR